MIIELTLPHPPSINSYWPSTKGGHKYLSPKAKVFRNEVVNIVDKAGYLNLKLQGSLRYTAVYHAPDKRRRDIDNFCSKAVLDALTHAGLYEDDCQIDEVYYRRGENIKDGAIVIKIEQI